MNIRGILRLINHYCIFFLVVAFVITCCTMLFVSTLERTLGITLTEDNIKTAAKITFLNVVLISIIFTLVDTIRRRFTVERPIKQLTNAAEKIIQGDFSVRLKHQSNLGADSAFKRVFECFNKIAEELGSVETLRTDFIANVSHEMKTPLGIIQNYGTLLQDPDLTEEQRIEYAKGVNDASRRMADMITNILKLNKLENRQIYPHAKVYDLSEQLCECILQYESIWESKSISIDTDIGEGVRIKADSELLSLVWNNLLSNAFKFTDKGGIVGILLQESEDHVTVMISDSGCGMSAEVGKHIFEKFYQGDTSHATEGNGLGLALVKKVVDVIQGEIKFESTVGVGTTVTVKLRKEIK